MITYYVKPKEITVKQITCKSHNRKDTTGGGRFFDKDRTAWVLDASASSQIKIVIKKIVICIVQKICVTHPSLWRLMDGSVLWRVQAHEIFPLKWFLRQLCEKRVPGDRIGADNSRRDWIWMLKGRLGRYHLQAHKIIICIIQKICHRMATRNENSDWKTLNQSSKALKVAKSDLKIWKTTAENYRLEPSRFSETWTLIRNGGGSSP